MAKKKGRKGLVFLIDQMRLVRATLEPQEQAEMYAALFDYAIEGKMPDVDSRSRTWRGIFELMKEAQDESRESYEETCERNSANARRRWSDECGRMRSDQVAANIREENRRKEKRGMGYGDLDDLDSEGTGVPGIGWLE